MPNESAHEVKNARHTISGVRAVDQRGGDDGAGIDHRVEWAIAPVVEHNRIELIARRLDADASQHRIAAMIVQREAIYERLRDRLEREGLPRVAHFVNKAVGGHEGDAELVRIDSP